MKAPACGPRGQRGFSLIELMVSVVIGLIVTLAVTGVMVASEERKRTSTATNDINQTGAYLAYVLDRAIRSAGSGFTQQSQGVLGCVLSASLNDQQILPAAALPSPFGKFLTDNKAVRVAPVIIGRNQADTGSDVLMVMAGSGGFAEAPLRLGPPEDERTITLANTLTWQAKDMLLLAGGQDHCLISQVDSTPAAGSLALKLGGPYFAASVAGTGVTAFTGIQAVAVPLGNADSRPPLFQLFGVSSSRTLVSYDLLRVAGAAPVPIADGVVALRALYGIDTNGDRTLDAWQRAEGAFSAAKLMDGSRESQDNLRRILAVRVGLVLRSQRQERNTVSPAELVLFQDLAGLQESFRPADGERSFRFRTIENTVPVRNSLL